MKIHLPNTPPTPKPFHSEFAHLVPGTEARARGRFLMKTKQFSSMQRGQPKSIPKSSLQGPALASQNPGLEG